MKDKNERIICNGCIHYKVRQEDNEYKATCNMGYNLLFVDISKTMRVYINADKLCRREYI